MNDLSILLLISIAVLVVILFMLYTTRENFASKEEKMNTLIGWFDKNKEPVYTEFKKIDGSNIVEYECARMLSNKGELTRENLSKCIL